MAQPPGQFYAPQPRAAAACAFVQVRAKPARVIGLPGKHVRPVKNNAAFSCYSRDCADIREDPYVRHHLYSPASCAFTTERIGGGRCCWRLSWTSISPVRPPPGY